jgi:GNAT superfamily N-acetyltransferase
MREPPQGYLLHAGVPDPADYLCLRQDSGLTPRTLEQAVLALPGSWAACHVVETDTGVTVAMGRLIGDGGWYFHVVDMAVLPAHQRRGIGDWVLTWLLSQIRQRAPADAFVSLMADPPGRRLYARHGSPRGGTCQSGWPCGWDATAAARKQKTRMHLLLHHCAVTGPVVRVVSAVASASVIQIGSACFFGMSYRLMLTPTSAFAAIPR